MARALKVGMAVVAGLILAAGQAGAAWGATADSLTISGDLGRDGVLTVTETLDLPGGVDRLTQRIPAYEDRDGLRYTYTLGEVSATADGAAVTPQVTRRSADNQVSLPVGGARNVTLTYTVTGTTTAITDDKINFLWPLVAGLDVDVTEVTGTVKLPPGAVNYDCSAGDPGALVTCSTYGAGTHGSTALSFTNKGLLAGQMVQADVIFPAGAVAVTEQVAPVWTLGRALTPGGAQLACTLGVLVVGGLVLYGVWRRMRTAGYDGLPVSVAGFDEQGRFITDPAARPGLIGTLVDTRVDPADVLATILDLAQRGHLRITELPTRRYQASDWSFTRLTSADETRPYERQLLDALTTSQVKVSALSGGVGAAIPAVQDAIYQEVLAAGWFSRLPSKRSPMVAAALVGLALAVVAAACLAVWTTYGLVGLACVAVAIVALAIAHQAPPISAKGAAVFAGLEELSKQLHTRTAEGLPADEQYAEISRVLPYAVVLGGVDRWLEAMVSADTDATPDSTDLDWYHAPEDWHMADLPNSLDAFITVVTGRLFARA